jgi:hypothetical protein
MDEQYILHVLTEMRRRLDEMLAMGRAIAEQVSGEPDSNSHRLGDRIDGILTLLQRRDELYRSFRANSLPEGCTLYDLSQSPEDAVRDAALAVMQAIDAVVRQNQELSERLGEVQGELRDRLQRVSQSIRFQSKYQRVNPYVPRGLRIDQEG